MSMSEAEQEEIIRLVALCENDPLKYARMAYPWGEGILEGSAGPRTWQTGILKNIKDLLDDPKTRNKPIQIAVSSGHGVGKSALVSMVIDWAMKMPDTKIVVTASTDKQLRTKTWPEVERWQKLSLTKDWFKVTATSVASLDPEHERTWRADAIAWNEEDVESFAGLHNKGKRIILIFDEASAISDKIWEVAEGAMTDEDTQIIWLAFGNPTRNNGRFRECFGRFKHRWITHQINSQDVEGTNKEQIQQWINDYGFDSDFVRVRVRGEFPRAGSMQFIAGDIVEKARKREPYHKVGDARVMGVDVARYGDDCSVIAKRVGRDAASHGWIRMRNVDTMTLAARIVQEAESFKPDAIFVDGGGVGGGVIDRLNMLRMPVIEVQFGAKSDNTNPERESQIIYADKAAEMWGAMNDWLRGGSIPDDSGLAMQLTGREYGFVLKEAKDAIKLEKKSDMKKRGLDSPDDADALALTFAYNVQGSDHTSILKTGSMHVMPDYNPLDFDRIRKGEY